MSGHSREYLEYLQSSAWQAKRRAKFRQVGRRCERGDLFCSGALQVHHKTYKHLGNEPLSDLIVLCEFHHHLADQKRRGEIIPKSVGVDWTKIGKQILRRLFRN